MRDRWLAILFSCAICFAPAANADDDGPGKGRGGSRELDAMARDLDNPRLTTRALGYVAFYGLLQGRDPKWAESVLRRELAKQVAEKKSPDVGQVPWRLGDNRITDRNAVEFVAHSVAPLMLAFGDKLSDGFKSEIRPKLENLLAGLRKRSLREDYTNIYLLNSADKILLGEILDDADAEREGAQQLDQIGASWRESGIHEFNSPTYYAVDHDALLMVFLHATNPALRDKARQMLDYLWADIAANYLPAAGRMTGPHSRDYDAVVGIGDIDQWAREYGLASDPFKASGYHSVFLVDNARGAGYRPPAATLKLATQMPREVVSRWGPQDFQTRTNYVTANGAIGCTNIGYGPQEKLFSVTLPAPPPFAQISLVGDTTGNPYGIKGEGDPVEAKPSHARTHFMCVQRRDVVLATADMGHGHTPEGDATLNLLLPADAQLSVDGRGVSLKPGARSEVRPDAIVTVRAAGGVAAFRIAAGPEWPIQIALVADRQGADRNAMRLEVSLPDNLTGKTAKRARLRMVMAAAIAPADQEGALVGKLKSAKLAAAANDDNWQTTLDYGGARLEIARSASKGDLIQKLRVDGHDAAGGRPLTVSGQDVAAQIWSAKKE